MESELPLIREFLKQRTKNVDASSIILVDSYQVTSRYYEELRTMAKVACLEDMGQSYPVDLLINYNIYGPKLVYDNKITHATLLGTGYQPLRREFQQDMQYDIKDKITDVMKQPEEVILILLRGLSQMPFWLRKSWRRRNCDTILSVGRSIPILHSCMNCMMRIPGWRFMSM